MHIVLKANEGGDDSGVLELLQHGEVINRITVNIEKENHTPGVDDGPKKPPVVVEDVPPLLRKKQVSKYDETAVKICVDEIVGEFAECTVCLETFNDPYITKCGHTFCKNCIHEVVNRQHKCPICN